MSDVGLAMQRAEERTQTLQARAGAIDELLASGALDDPTGMAKDDITAELDRLSSSQDVEPELQRLRASCRLAHPPRSSRPVPPTGPWRRQRPHGGAGGAGRATLGSPSGREMRRDRPHSR